jgi:HPt (histidine-containing phosphotransfer) domain-containing protein
MQLGQRQQTPAVFERQQLIERCRGKMDLAERLIQLLVDSLPNELEDLRSAMKAEDTSRIAKQSHRLKGMASNMCADRLSAAAAMLERSARASDVSTTSDLWLAVEREIESLQELLRTPSTG